MRIKELLFAAKTIYRFRSYRPQKLTFKNTIQWLNQFPEEDRTLVCKLTKHIKYVNESEFKDQLIKRNNALLKYLTDLEIPYKNIVYVAFDDAGSSSQVILNMLRDNAGLDRLGCKLINADSIDRLTELTNKLSSGAIVFVDDFAGTGNQFIATHQFIGGAIIGNFAQYLLLHTVCEEAVGIISNRGVEIWQQDIHQKKDRPLNPASTLLSSQERKRLSEICKLIASKGGLGYKNLAGMIVFERNAPNALPLIFRGDKGQKKYKGLVPRTTDLPPPLLV